MCVIIYDRVVHQTVTLRKLYNKHSVILARAPPTTADSWFPGYGWTITHCANCYSHLGWLFTRNPQSASDKSKRQTSSHAPSEDSNAITEFWYVNVFYAFLS